MQLFEDGLLSEVERAAAPEGGQLLIEIEAVRVQLAQYHDGDRLRVSTYSGLEGDTLNAIE